MPIRHKFASATYHAFDRLPSLIVGKLHRNAVNAYWYRDVTNFGDLITPALLRHFGFTPVHSYPKRADVVGTGSILEHVEDTYSGVVLGSGFMYASSHREFAKARVLSVRGKLTRERLSPSHSRAGLGDPGLLAPLLLSQREQKKHTLGLVLHHANTTPAFLQGLLSRYRGEIAVIDVMRQPAEVARDIDRCQFVLSSSLHGLIVAEALRVPSAWIAEDKVLGGRFKFDDYYSSLNSTAAPISGLLGSEKLSELTQRARLQSTSAVEEVQAASVQLFDNLREALETGR